jgi:hypothetical protein
LISELSMSESFHARTGAMNDNPSLRLLFFLGPELPDESAEQTILRLDLIFRKVGTLPE